MNTIIDYNGKLILYKGVFSKYSFDTILNDVNPTSETIKLFNKDIVVPRLVEYQGLKDHSYSNVIHQAKPFSPLMGKLIQYLNDKCQFDFNAVLINLYRNGDDYMGYHKDDEKGLDQSLIASLTFGAPRKFVVKHEDGNKKEVILEHGDLLLLFDFQKSWKHSLPKSKHVKHPRLNLTFRKIL